MQILCIELVVEEQGFIGWLSRYMGFFVTSPGHSCKTVKIILTLYLENSDSKDDWKQKTWEDLVLKVMPTKSCSKNLIDYSMSRLPARYSVFFFFFSFIVSYASYVCLGFFNIVCFWFVFLFVGIQFVSKSIDEVDSEIWTSSLGAEMTNQIPLYANLPEEKVCRPII